jgi:hypothetical protein
MTQIATASPRPSDHEIEDINDYIAALTQEERDGLPVAEAALDLAMLLDRAQRRRASTSGDSTPASDLGGVAADAFARAGVMEPLTAFRRYLRALGYEVEVEVVDLASGEPAVRVAVPPTEDAT